jgi:hypothetical protein
MIPQAYVAAVSISRALASFGDFRLRAVLDEGFKDLVQDLSAQGGVGFVPQRIQPFQAQDVRQ